MLDLKDLSKAKVLAALYNKAKVQGMGFLQAKPGNMTEKEAQELLDNNKGEYFDYVHGRVMKIRFEGNTIQRTDLYNRDNGQGAAEEIIENLRKNQ